MSFEMVDNVLNITADSTMTLAMAAVLLLIGYFVRRKASFLTKYCIPAPVVGGFLFMFVTFAGHMTETFAFTFYQLVPGCLHAGLLRHRGPGRQL